MTEREQRDRLEALHAELRALEQTSIATRARLEEARHFSANARRREREAALSKQVPLFSFGPLRRFGVDALRWGIVTVLVMALFAAVIGTINFTLNSYDGAVARRHSR